MFAVLNFPEFSPFVFILPQIELGSLSLGPFPIRWYALSYLLGIAASFYYASKILKRPHLYGGKTPPVKQEDMDEVLFWSFIGIILGGRLGYILFYRLPHGAERSEIGADPMSLLRLWEGGLAFHGGFLGVCLAVYLIARARKIPLLNFADIGAMIAPISIFSVRILGNFMNAELYGRQTTSPLGMVFPEGYAVNNYGPPIAYDAVEKAWVYLGTELPRYPSQIFEGILEGLLPTLLLAFLAWRYKILTRPGLATGLFLILYGIGRSIAENFREPDQHIGFLFGDVTTGMLLSAPMWMAGAWLIWRSLARTSAKL